MNYSSSERQAVDYVVLPHFMRIQWVSNETREFWEPVMETAVRSNVLSAIARIKLKYCTVAVIKFKPSRIFDVKQQLLKHGLFFSVTKPFEANGLLTTEAPCKYQSTDQSQYLIVAASRKEISNFEALLEENSVIEIHKQLGLTEQPSTVTDTRDICVRILADTFGTRMNISPNQWHISLLTDDPDSMLAKQLIFSYLGLNLIWRYDRLVFSSQTFSEVENIMNFIKEDNHAVYQSLLDFLSLPVLLSDYHGILEVKTPVFKFITNSNPSQTNMVMQIEGNRGKAVLWAKGLRFPYLSR